VIVIEVRSWQPADLATTIAQFCHLGFTQFVFAKTTIPARVAQS
jgi:hypothetical protein